MKFHFVSSTYTGLFFMQLDKKNIHLDFVIIMDFCQNIITNIFIFIFYRYPHITKIQLIYFGILSFNEEEM